MNDVFPEKDGRDPVFRVGDILARVGHADGVSTMLPLSIYNQENGGSSLHCFLFVVC